MLMTRNCLMILCCISLICSGSTTFADREFDNKRWGDAAGKELDKEHLEEDEDLEEDEEFEDEEEFEGDWAEEEVEPSALPVAVVNRLKRTFTSLRVVSAMKEAGEGEEHYFIFIDAGDYDAEVGISADGELSFMERRIRYKNLPKEVREAVAKDFKGLRVFEASQFYEKDEEESMSGFHLAIRNSKREVYATYSRDGELLEEEEGEEDDEEFDEEEFEEDFDEDE